MSEGDQSILLKNKYKLPHGFPFFLLRFRKFAFRLGYKTAL